MKQKKGTQWVPKKQEDPGLLARLSRPTGPVDVVLDTDTYNEIDDQFAARDAGSSNRHPVFFQRTIRGRWDLCKTACDPDRFYRKSYFGRIDILFF